MESIPKGNTLERNSGISEVMKSIRTNVEMY